MEKVERFFGISLPSFWGYTSLLKPRVVLLVFFTAICSIVLASYSVPALNVQSALIALFCIACGSGGAGAVNMWYDRDIDALMSRTKTRSIPQGIVSAKGAIIFALLLCSFSALLMTFAVNALSGGLLAFAIFYYAVIYTMLLKRRTAQNIVIGGAAGAFPPVIAWSAVTGHLGIESIILFLIIFFWTPPHFWALALRASGDYKIAGIPMLPVVRGHKATKIQIIVYSVLLVAVGLLPCIFGFSGMFYFIASFVLGSLFIWHSIAVYKDESKCMRMFYFSVMYLFLLFAAIVIDKVILVHAFGV